jgi:hypothetical protein
MYAVTIGSDAGHRLIRYSSLWRDQPFEVEYARLVERHPSADDFLAQFVRGRVILEARWVVGIAPELHPAESGMPVRRRECSKSRSVLVIRIT